MAAGARAVPGAVSPWPGVAVSVVITIVTVLRAKWLAYQAGIGGTAATAAVLMAGGGWPHD